MGICLTGHEYPLAAWTRGYSFYLINIKLEVAFHENEETRYSYCLEPTG